MENSIETPAATTRIDSLPVECLQNLGRMVSWEQVDVQIRTNTYLTLPRGMSFAEIQELGHYVSETTRRSPVRAMQWLGSDAWAHGDTDTADNTRQYLKTQGVRGKLAAMVLKWEAFWN